MALSGLVRRGSESRRRRAISAGAAVLACLNRLRARQHSPRTGDFDTTTTIGSVTIT